MLLLILVVLAATFALLVGIGLLFSKTQPMQPDGTSYSAEILEQASKSTKKTAKIIIACAAVVLLGCLTWYFSVYNSKANIERRNIENSVQQEQLNEIRMQRVARERVSVYLKDPDSAKFRDQTGNCGFVNAKNSFGAYGGFKRFISLTSEIVLIEGGDSVTPTQFEETWAKACAS